MKIYTKIQSIFPMPRICHLFILLLCKFCNLSINLNFAVAPRILLLCLYQHVSIKSLCCLVYTGNLKHGHSYFLVCVTISCRYRAHSVCEV